MRVIIKDNEVGFVTKNGSFVKTITSGKYFFSKTMGYEVHVEEMKGEVTCEDIPYQVLAKDTYFQENTVRFQIPEGYAGIIYVNDRIYMFAEKREYVFWNVFEKYDIQLISMEDVEIGPDVSRQMLRCIPRQYFDSFIVDDGEVCILYYDQVFQKVLQPGTYHFWNYKTRVFGQGVNMKLQELNIAGQEILTKDKIGIRMNVICAYKVIDPVNLVANIQDYEGQLRTLVQMTIRELVGNYKLDEILEQKEMISKELFEILKAKGATYYVEFLNSGIKDIILPGEVREIMNSVLVAEKMAQANVISRREEVASTRSLLNTAKLMEENKTLYKLKELEYLERICDKVGEISVNGNAGLMEQLGLLLGAR